MITPAVRSWFWVSPENRMKPVGIESIGASQLESARPLNGERQEVGGRNRRLLIFKHDGFVRDSTTSASEFFAGEEVLPPLHKCLLVSSALLSVGLSTRRWLARIVRHLHVRKFYGINGSLS